MSLSNILKSFFEVEKRGTNLKVEVIAGITTFLSMAYILFVNPTILTDGFSIALHQALGISMSSPLPEQYQGLLYSVRLGFTAATAISAAVATLIMALYAKLPFALAPGMGENAFIAYTIIPLFADLILSAQKAVGVEAAQLAISLALISVLFNGILFLIFSVGKIREFIINSVPESLKLGIGIGIGLFITLIGFADVGIVKGGVATPVTFNTSALTSYPFYLGMLSFVVAAVLLARKVIGGFIIAILASTIAAGLLGLISAPQNLLMVPVLSTSILNDLPRSFYLYLSLFGIGFPIAFSLFLVDFFDGIGTITALATKANLVQNGRIVGINRALITDAFSSILAPFFGTSTVVVYVESASGIEQGGRTGLTALVTSLLFFASIALTPLFTVIPSYATGGVLMLVGLLFLSLAGNLTKLEDYSELVPAFVTITSIPFTYSITTGIGLGFITYTLIKLLTGKFKDLKPGVIVITLLFVLYFILSAKGF
ncbi:MAG: NCS2 family permease [Thermoprotei archaeon]|jgi:AGZA family xanthine/uracil permease-like MFS transporter|nr:NCS2 family permease [Thermoprotei archaeon]